MKVFELIGYKKNSRIKVSVEANAAKNAVRIASVKYPGYSFLTTKDGRISSPTMINMLNLLRLKVYK